MRLQVITQAAGRLRGWARQEGRVACLGPESLPVDRLGSLTQETDVTRGRERSEPGCWSCVLCVCPGGLWTWFRVTQVVAILVPSWVEVWLTPQGA